MSHDWPKVKRFGIQTQDQEVVGLNPKAMYYNIQNCSNIIHQIGGK